MTTKYYFQALAALVCLAISPIAMAQQSFRDLVGNVPVKAVESSKTLSVPYITWGGDVATFLANGDLKTQPGSIDWMSA